ncbi:hypothetical protein FCV63_07690 [Vibrio lentus]|uniref:hypothetical protein n=1 Tax=Vibrio lentus TaxID=136468 RepID=UPI000C8622E0|nr:hypothetical protein [Vibrio lentus]PME66077.1 hypothetical protein BCV33_01885 [Vibrio lentus]PMG61475.1 hypothetical protein BCU87_14300 [Vibrio lentus]PMN01881.1 hypothetical protein BCT40_22915 [Vibrio lentus]TKF58580.1 hypothetical protein FCV63_07690 [Vibrio lentus]
MKRNLQQSDREHSKRWMSSIKKTGKKRHSFGGSGSTVIEQMSLKTLFGKPIIDVPSIFNFVATHLDDITVDLLSKLDTVLEHYSHIYLSFENTKEIKLPMLLTLYAIQDKHDAKITVIWSKSRLVNRTIMSAGSFTSRHKRREDLFDNNVSFIPVVSGSNQEFDNLSDDLVDAINDKYYCGNMPANIESRISQAIIETIENVGRHAYPGEPDDSDKKWWLICSVSEPVNGKDERLMYLAIYDSGRGIPLSLEDSAVFQHRVKKHYPEEYNQLIHGTESDNTKTGRIGQFVRSINAMVKPLRESIGDSGLIYASMMHDMTSLDDENHGQGSVSIKNVVTDDPDSNLIIISNRGCYQYNKGSDEEYVMFELQNELSGTLLQWSIKLNELC